MKNILFSCLLMCTLFVNASSASTDDASDPSSHNLVNLIYFAHSGNFVFEPGFSSSIDGHSNGNEFSTTNINLEATYGLFVDGLRVSVSASDNVDGFNNGSNSYNSNGFGDPDFSLNYRIIDQNSAGISWDVQLSVSPSIAEYASSDNGYTGSDGKGFTDGELSSAVYWSRGSNELKLGAGLLHEFSATITDHSDPGFPFSRGSEWEANFNLVDRIHLCPRFYIQGAATFYLPYSISVGYSDGNTGATSYPFHVNPELSVGFLQSKNFLITTYISYFRDTTSYLENTGYQSQDLSYNFNWGMDMVLEF